MAHRRVLIIGGYGGFGRLLSRRLAAETDIELIIAGRSGARARAHCAAHGGRGYELDASGDLADPLRTIAPDIVIDASGPFQVRAGDGHRVARAALAVGAHYLDLADDAEFVDAVSTLDEQARAAGRAVISGCSTLPAISAAAADYLCTGLARVESVECCLLPGSRAPRGRSVISAVLAQVGRPLRVREAGMWIHRTAWAATERRCLRVVGVRPLPARPASLIGAPDLALFPARYGARTVRFLAGLEPGITHRGLVLLARGVRFGLVGNLCRVAGVLRWLAGISALIGSDRGGMQVCMTGWTADGEARKKTWTLIAEAGDGPQVPVTPAYLLVRRMLAGEVAPGARPCLDELMLDDLVAGLAPFAVRTATVEERVVPLFEAVLGAPFGGLPAPLRRLHRILDRDAFVGEAKVTRGTHPVARLVGAVFGFPPAADAVPVRVDMVRTEAGERWTRTFGARSFRSHLSRQPDARPGEIHERFGALSFRLPLTVGDGEIDFPVAGGRLMGLVPLPGAVLPRSEAREFVDNLGRACFDVRLSLPWFGVIVRYQGWLRPVDAGPADGPSPVHNRIAA